MSYSSSFAVPTSVIVVKERPVPYRSNQKGVRSSSLPAPPPSTTTAHAHRNDDQMQRMSKFWALQDQLAESNHNNNNNQNTPSITTTTTNTKESATRRRTPLWEEAPAPALVTPTSQPPPRPEGGRYEQDANPDDSLSSIHDQASQVRDVDDDSVTPNDKDAAGTNRQEDHRGPILQDYQGHENAEEEEEKKYDSMDYHHPHHQQQQPQDDDPHHENEHLVVPTEEVVNIAGTTVSQDDDLSAWLEGALQKSPSPERRHHHHQEPIARAASFESAADSSACYSNPPPIRHLSIPLDSSPQDCTLLSSSSSSPPSPPRPARQHRPLAKSVFNTNTANTTGRRAPSPYNRTANPTSTTPLAPANNKIPQPIAPSSRLLQPTASFSGTTVRRSTPVRSSMNVVQVRSKPMARPQPEQRLKDHEARKAASPVPSRTNSLGTRTPPPRRFTAQEAQTRARARVYLRNTLQQLDQERHDEQEAAAATAPVSPAVFPAPKRSSQPLTVPQAPKLTCSNTIASQNRLTPTRTPPTRTRSIPRRLETDHSVAGRSANSNSGIPTPSRSRRVLAAASTTSSVVTPTRGYGADFVPTRPQSFRFATAERASARSSTTRSTTASQGGSSVGGGSAKTPTRSWHQRPLTVPVAPKFLLDAKYGSKTPTRTGTTTTTTTTPTNHKTSRNKTLTTLRRSRIPRTSTSTSTADDAATATSATSETSTTHKSGTTTSVSVVHRKVGVGGPEAFRRSGGGRPSTPHVPRTNRTLSTTTNAL